MSLHLHDVNAAKGVDGFFESSVDAALVGDVESDGEEVVLGGADVGE